MQKAQKGDGADKSINWNKTKREKQPRKYRRHKKEGRVSKYDFRDTLAFGYTDWQTYDPYHMDRGDDTDSIEEVDYYTYGDTYGDFSEVHFNLQRLGYYNNYVDFGTQLEIPISQDDTSGSVLSNRITQADFVDLVRWLRYDRTICGPDEKTTACWTYEEAEILSHAVDGKPFNPYACSVELIFHLAFSPLWNTSPNDLCEEDAQSRSVLLQHLYGKFEVPEFLLNQVHERAHPNRTLPDYVSPAALSLLVYVVMTRGFSIAGILKLVSNYRDYSKRITKCLWSIPNETCPDVGITAAYFNSLNITLEIALQLSLCEKVRSLEIEILQWFKKFHARLQVDDVNLLVNYMRHRCDENWGQPISFCAGPARMLREARDYEEAIQREEQRNREREEERRIRIRSLSYRQHTQKNTGPFKDDNLRYGMRDGARQVDFIQLRNEDQLYEEGKTMHHCVAFYVNRCSSGDCAIVSMRVNRKPTLTIEVLRAHKTIAQIRGRLNRFPTEEERYWIWQWSEEKSLVYNF